MKVLEIFGDDYAAVMYDNEVATGRLNPQDLWVRGRGVYESDKNGAYFEYSAREFGEVDPTFIEFVRNEIIDYDDSKHHNFYVL